MTVPFQTTSLTRLSSYKPATKNCLSKTAVRSKSCAEAGELSAWRSWVLQGSYSSAGRPQVAASGTTSGGLILGLFLALIVCAPLLGIGFYLWRKGQQEESEFAQVAQGEEDPEYGADPGPGERSGDHCRTATAPRVRGGYESATWWANSFSAGPSIGKKVFSTASRASS